MDDGPEQTSDEVFPRRPVENAPKYQYRTADLEVITVINMLAVPDDETAYDYFETVLRHTGWHPKGTPRYIERKCTNPETGKEEWKMLPVEYDAVANEVVYLDQPA